MGHSDLDEHMALELRLWWTGQSTKGCSKMGSRKERACTGQKVTDMKVDFDQVIYTEW